MTTLEIADAKVSADLTDRVPQHAGFRRDVLGAAPQRRDVSLGGQAQGQIAFRIFSCAPFSLFMLPHGVTTIGDYRLEASDFGASLGNADQLC